MIRGDPYLETAASRPRAVLSSANFVKSTARGGTCSQGEVPVASPPGYSYAGGAEFFPILSSANPNNCLSGEYSQHRETLVLLIFLVPSGQGGVTVASPPGYSYV